MIPALLAVNPALPQAVERLTRALRADSALLETLAKQAYDRASSGGDGLDTAVLRTLDPALQSRCLRLLLEGGGVEPSGEKIALLGQIILEKGGKLRWRAENTPSSAAGGSR